MRRWRGALVVAGGLLVVAAVGDATLQVVVRPRVMAAVSRLVGAPASAARLRVSPFGGVRLRGLRAGDAVTVRSLRIDLEPGAALEGQLRPTRVVAEGVRVRLDDGLATLRAWRDRATQARGGAARDGAPRRPLQLEVTDLEVVAVPHGATIRAERLEGTGGAQAVTVTGRDVTVGVGPAALVAAAVRLEAPASLAPPVSVELSGGRALVHQDLLADRLTASLRLDPGGGEVRASARAPGTEGAAREVSLSARFGDDGGEARLSAAAFPLRALAQVLAPAGLLVEQSTAELEVSGRWRGPLRRGMDVGATGRVTARDLGLRLPRLAARDVMGIHATLDGSARVRGDGVEIDRATLQLGAIRATVRASVAALAARPRLSRWATLPEAGCQVRVDALPPGLAPALQGLQLAGRLSASLALTIDWAQLDRIEHEESIDARACRALRDPPAADVAALTGPFRHRGVDAAGRPREFTLGPENPSYRPLDRISRHVVSAFLTAEDRRFWQHSGFDAAMLGKALAHDLAAGRVEKGASTITQQLAKNLFLKADRTIGRKLEEAVIAWRLEQVLPKRRILELYLNAIELGPGLYGVAEATRTYFGRDVATVGPLEAAHLAALTPNPKLFARRIEAPDARARWLDHLYELLAMMQRAHRVTPGEVEAARARGLQLSNWRGPG
ncbi:MAG: transglycosylase domain-containing protein [Deltaproteobacteria bacterium]|nr:transglycosylase domain-containing protein [Deltaproteobacteria bacterium]